MTARIELDCNGDECGQTFSMADIIGSLGVGEIETVEDFREIAKDHNWTYAPGNRPEEGRDYCADCSAPRDLIAENWDREEAAAYHRLPKDVAGGLEAVTEQRRVMREQLAASGAEIIDENRGAGQMAEVRRDGL